MFGLAKEIKPPLFDEGIIKLVTAFGGSLDKNKTKAEIVKDEVLEETGLRVDLTDIHYVGRYFVSTQMNQWCYLYWVDVTAAEYIGQKLEATENVGVVWKTKNEIMMLNDWKSIVIVSKEF